ncbi:MAG: thiazole synthase [Candidatus Omnitrophica bacterium]|nr:thiazole synthase [Candidatus Omnitrophota bacterium]MDD5487814.1 thiazole synthase [Candidatus Omnitrophota bacterium]
MDPDQFEMGGYALRSRLLIGTGKFRDKSFVREAVEASNAAMVTVAVRRIDPGSKEENILEHIPGGCILVPNTSGARNAGEAIRIARISRAAGCGEWVKIEVIPDNKHLLPDNLETLKAVDALAKEGFKVLPYMSPDLAMGRRMAEAGAVAVMPLGAPIGTNRGFRTEELVRIMVREIKVPVIVDAGLGRPSDAAKCMEIGCAAVLVNTAIAAAEDHVKMAGAFAMAVAAGRACFLSGPGELREQAEASSPLTGFLRGQDDV